MFNDWSTNVQELAKYSAALSAYDAAVAAQHGQLDPGPLPPIPTFPDLYNDPVLNPASALTLIIQNSLSSGFGANAAEVGWTGIYQNDQRHQRPIRQHLNPIGKSVEWR